MTIGSVRVGRLLMILLVIALLSPPLLADDDPIEESGERVGVLVGNLIYVPLKAATMALALPQGVMAWVLSLGDDEQAEEIWSSNWEEPYLLTPEVARSAIGERPELTADMH